MISTVDIVLLKGVLPYPCICLAVAKIPRPAQCCINQLSPPPALLDPVSKLVFYAQSTSVIRPNLFQDCQLRVEESFHQYLPASLGTYQLSCSVRPSHEWFIKIL